MQTSEDVDQDLTKSHFVQTEIPFPMREKDFETELAEKMEKEFKDKE